jgi:hypothetical protein
MQWLGVNFINLCCPGVNSKFLHTKKITKLIYAAREHSKTATYLMGQMAILAQQKLGKQNSHFDFVLLMD